MSAKELDWTGMTNLPVVLSLVRSGLYDLTAELIAEDNVFDEHPVSLRLWLVLHLILPTAVHQSLAHARQDGHEYRHGDNHAGGLSRSEGAAYH